MKTALFSSTNATNRKPGKRLSRGLLKIGKITPELFIIREGLNEIVRAVTFAMVTLLQCCCSFVWSCVTMDVYGGVSRSSVTREPLAGHIIRLMF